MSTKLKLNQVTRRRLTEEIVDQLVSLIVSGKLKRGNKLPPERELMKQLGVGRSSLREAIGSLSLIGVLVVRPGSGTYVTVSREEFLAKPLSWGIPIGHGRTQELVEARRILEEATASLAAERASEADIAEMRYHLTQMKTNRRHLRKVINADMSFHETLAKASYNSLLLNFLMQIGNLLRSWKEETLLIPGVYDSAVEEHEKILSAIEEHNAERARAALCRHLESVGDALASVVLKRTPSDTSP